MSDFATAGGHWYRLDNGEPCYTIVGKNGKERPTTLRDARALALVPSVTGIIRCAAAPQLEKWKRNQLLLSALTLPRIDGETEEAWLARVEQDWQEEGRAAADRGTQIHAAIEQHFRGEIPDEEMFPYVMSAKDAILAHCGEQAWSSERSFAHFDGYGGKTDLHSQEWVIDVKTKDPPFPDKLYDEHLMQLAAYRRGLNVQNARCAILYVGRYEPTATLVEAPPEAIERGAAMFSAMLGYWQAKNSYAPVALRVAA